jgi:hypothetical protein
MKRFCLFTRAAPLNQLLFVNDSSIVYTLSIWTMWDFFFPAIFSWKGLSQEIFKYGFWFWKLNQYTNFQKTLMHYSLRGYLKGSVQRKVRWVKIMSIVGYWPQTMVQGIICFFFHSPPSYTTCFRFHSVPWMWLISTLARRLFFFPN